MELFDLTVKALADAKLMIILNNHTSDAIWCCNPLDKNGAWWNKNYSADDFYDVLVGMTKRYLHEPYVIGNDLRNEVRLDGFNLILPRWGNGNERSDWKMMAEKVGNGILEVNPHHLIIVESVESGANFSRIIENPLVLNVPN